MKQKSLTTEEFIERAIKVHGDKYDYSLVEYINCTTKVKIICKKCQKVFEQVASYHLQKNGCIYCNKARTYTTEEFIQQAKEKYGDEFDYSLVKYVNRNTKVNIICKIHGKFETYPYYFLNS